MFRSSSAIVQSSSKTFTRCTPAAESARLYSNITNRILSRTNQQGIHTILNHQTSITPVAPPRSARLAKLSSSHSKTMSTTPSLDPAITSILHFWFEELSFEDWFKDSSKHDSTIRTRFAHLVEQARTTDTLDSTWLSTPSGSLAMILLLDQFSRNIYRPGTHPTPHHSFTADPKALRIAATSISKGFDRAIQAEHADTKTFGKCHRYFFYLPFMHAEDLPSQVASVALIETMREESEVLRLRRQVEGKDESEGEKGIREWLTHDAVLFAVRHRECVAQLGRFPKRNEPLGREDTEEERRWLEEHPIGF